MTCAQGLLRLLWGGPKLECYGTALHRVTVAVRFVFEKEKLVVGGRCVLNSAKIYFTAYFTVGNPWL